MLTGIQTAASDYFSFICKSYRGIMDWIDLGGGIGSCPDIEYYS